MPSNFTGFDVGIDEDNGTRTPVPNKTVKVYDATNGAALPDLVSDANGHVAAGQLNVAVGTRVFFRVENHQGMAGYAEQVTT